MKRFVCIAIFLLFAFTLTAPQARAENTMFTTTRLNNVASTAVVIGNWFGFDIAGLIVPFFTKDSENAYIDYEPYYIYMKQYADWNMPGAYVQNGIIIDWLEGIYRTSLYGAILKASAPHGDDVTSPDCVISQGLQTSSIVQYLNNLFQYLEGIDAMRGIQPKYADANGFIDFRKIKQVLYHMVGEDCKRQDIGLDTPPAGNDQVKLSTFGGGGTRIDAFMRDTIMVIVSRLVHHTDGTSSVESVEKPLMEGAKQQVILTKKTREPYQEMLCHAGSFKCDNDQVGPETTGLNKHGGFPAGFIGANEQKRVEPNGQVQDDITILGFPAGGSFNNQELVAHHMKVGLQEASCMVTGSGKSQDIAVMGSQVKPIPIKDACRDGTVTAQVASIPPDATSSNLVTAAAACTPAGSGGGSSGNVGAAVAAAASKLGIPKCVLDGVAHMEGAYDGNACAPNACGAVGPFAITVGHTYANKNGQCTVDTSCSSCGAGSCPNALQDFLSGYSEADMCDVNKAAEAAATMLKGKTAYFGESLSGTDTNAANMADAIITAGNSYFGSNYVFSSGSNVQPGCSYGESLLVKYCGVKSYTCGSNNISVSASSTQ